MNKLFDKAVVLSIGPQHCGTAWIHEYLSARGDVCLPDVKEIFYFDRHFLRGPEFYASHFSPRAGDKIITELTTTAFDYPDAPDHVYKLLGADVRLFCPLRHPVERSKAAYADYLKYGLVKGGIEEATQAAPQILYASRYADHLDRWFAQFGKKNVKIIFYESLRQNPDQFVAELCGAMDIPFMPPRPPGGLWAKFKTAFRGQNEERPVVLSAADEEWLKSRLQPEVGRLENLLGNSISYWKY